MTVGAGVVRDEASLADAMDVATGAAAVAAEPRSPEAHEVANLAVVARALITAASARAESRGAHARRDHPATDPARRHRLVLA